MDLLLAQALLGRQPVAVRDEVVDHAVTRPLGPRRDVYAGELVAVEGDAAVDVLDAALRHFDGVDTHEVRRLAPVGAAERVRRAAVEADADPAVARKLHARRRDGVEVLLAAPDHDAAALGPHLVLGDRRRRAPAHRPAGAELLGGDDVEDDAVGVTALHPRQVSGARRGVGAAAEQAAIDLVEQVGRRHSLTQRPELLAVGDARDQVVDATGADLGGGVAEPLGVGVAPEQARVEPLGHALGVTPTATWEGGGAHRTQRADAVVPTQLETRELRGAGPHHATVPIVPVPAQLPGSGVDAERGDAVVPAAVDSRGGAIDDGRGATEVLVLPDRDLGRVSGKR